MIRDDPSVAILHKVRLRYGRKVALDNISLTIARGKRIALIGPDGVGKSSF
jgi:ribosome-dependent ATPase